ncbi:MAG: acetylglutamate kinase [Prevotella sp.]|nr:acetylglutamate kinase [Prevotella sp.]
MINVIKVGGAIVEDEVQLSALLDSFAQLEGDKILVHGGGRRATKVATSLGIETKMVEGRRITDGDMIDVVTMVYGGLVNKNVVAQLQARGVKALGLTGADADIIRSHKRPLKNGIDYGFVGDVDKVDAQTLIALLNAGIVPIVAPLTHDGNGQILNTNADTMAGETAKALAMAGEEVTLTYCFEKKGVLSNPDDDESVIPMINRASYEKYASDGTISGGMMPKIENALAAVESGVKKVVITRADNLCGGTIIQ